MTVIEVVVMSYRSFPSIGQISDKHTLSASAPIMGLISKTTVYASIFSSTSAGEVIPSGAAPPVPVSAGVARPLADSSLVPIQL
jgi:hypothetical protein